MAAMYLLMSASMYQGRSNSSGGRWHYAVGVVAVPGGRAAVDENF